MARLDDHWHIYFADPDMHRIYTRKEDQQPARSSPAEPVMTILGYGRNAAPIACLVFGYNEDFDQCVSIRSA